MRSLSGRTVDLLVIGGGIVGAGIARDAALRGLSVALVEQHDLASGTTSRPTRLIHGGLRYLELFDFGLVRTDMREREILLRIAPHLVLPLPFPDADVPAAASGTAPSCRSACSCTTRCRSTRACPSGKWLNRDETLRAEPALDPDGLQGAWQFYDAQVPLVERLVVENALDASRARRARSLTHARRSAICATAARVTGAVVHDTLAGREISRCAPASRSTRPGRGSTARSRRCGRSRAAAAADQRHPPGHARGDRQAHVLFAKSDGRLVLRACPGSRSRSWARPTPITRATRPTWPRPRRTCATPEGSAPRVSRSAASTRSTTRMPGCARWSAKRA